VEGLRERLRLAMCCLASLRSRFDLHRRVSERISIGGSQRAPETGYVLFLALRPKRQGLMEGGGSQRAPEALRLVEGLAKGVAAQGPRADALESTRCLGTLRREGLESGPAWGPRLGSRASLGIGELEA
jgi:hypothetical protein